MTRETFSLETRCSRCKRFAYTEEFEGELGEEGYLCIGCLRILNQELATKLKEEGGSDG